MSTEDIRSELAEIVNEVTGIPADNVQLDKSFTEDLDVDSWNIGLRYSFGGGLQARDRAGAALPGSGVMGILGAL